MSANFYNGKGVLNLHTNQEGCFINDLTLEILEEKYYDFFKRFSEKEILRSSFLRVNGKIKHEFEI